VLTARRAITTAVGLPHRCCAALQDTVTGFLLAGVGNVDLRRKGNFLVVNESAARARGACALRTRQLEVAGRDAGLPRAVQPLRAGRAGRAWARSERYAITRGCRAPSATPQGARQCCGGAHALAAYPRGRASLSLPGRSAGALLLDGRNVRLSSSASSTRFAVGSAAAAVPWACRLPASQSALQRRRVRALQNYLCLMIRMRHYSAQRRP